VKLLLIAALLSIAAPAPSYDWNLVPAGWGPVRIGMDRAQVEKALEVELQGDAFDNEGSCIELFPKSEELKGTYFMFLDGKLSRITVVESDLVATPRGIHIGSTADEVRAAYGEKLQAEEHGYLGQPAEYLTYWLKPKASGVRFETDGERKVAALRPLECSRCSR
jgi:hypothetical protein